MLSLQRKILNERKVNGLHHLKPMLAKIKLTPFDNKNWIFETKYDGYRALALCNGKGKVELYSRNLLSFNSNYPGIVDELKKIPHSCLLDGEITAEDKNGVSHFQLLQHHDKQIKYDLKYYVFDILNLNGHDLTHLSLIERKELLRLLLKKTKMKHVLYSEHIIGKGISFYKRAVKKKEEGIMAKDSQSPYRINKRSNEWYKIKIVHEQEAIICGITEPKGSRSNFGALLLGVYNHRKLKYIGKCGTGFDDESLKELYHLFKPCFIDKPPFKISLKTKDKIQWLEPKYVCQVKFTEWTMQGSMRHPVFMGLRHDKNPKEVIREKIALK